MKTTIQLILCLLVLPTSIARADDLVLKNSAIAGSLATYAFAYLNRDAIAPCTKSVRGTAQSGKDQELSVTTVGASFADCNLSSQRRPLGLDLRISPTLLFSNWTADSGAGERSASELTFVPRAQYVWTTSFARLDTTFGIGVSYLSAADVGARNKSTNFQFSDEISVGISDPSDWVRLGFNYRHISNADIRKPNNGVDYHGISLTVRLP
jgi:hypothetical protein